MMLNCKLDGVKFADPQTAMKHIRASHLDLVYDAWLKVRFAVDPTRESEERVFESQIKEEE